MRQLGTLPKEIDPKVFADYLLTLGMRIRVDEQPEGWSLWIYNEDHLERARDELRSFQSRPEDPRYLEAVEAAKAIRRQEQQLDQQFRKNYREVSALWAYPGLRRRPLTFTLAAFSLVGFLLLESPKEGVVLEKTLTFSTSHVDPEGHERSNGLKNILQGEVWRLVTPIFLHFGILHLLFNVWALSTFGTMIEVRRGTLRLAGMVLFAAVLSNLGQYLYMERIDPGEPQLFGGMSGVICALFGYIWMKGLYQPEQGMILHPNSITFVLLWLALCMTGMMGPIANAAHVVGLVVGVAFGVIDISKATRWPAGKGKMGSVSMIRSAPGAAVIGGGFIGPVHVEALRRIGVEVVGLLGSSPGRARATADRLAIPRVYGDLDQLLGDERVGIVHVASPNEYHFEQTKRVLESGRHVICEKPLAISSQEAATLQDLALSRPAQAAAVNYNVRYYPLCREIRGRMGEGALGRVLSVTGSYVQDWLLYPEDFNWRVERGGPANLRAVADIGTHWMDLAQFLLGMPVRAVFADLATFHTTRKKPAGPSETYAGPGDAACEKASREVEITTDDHAAILLRFDGGARGNFHVSQVTAGRKNRLTLEIAATKGALCWDSDSPNRLWIGSRNGPNHLLERDPALLGPAAASLAHYPGGHAEGFPDTFKQLYLDVYGWISAGRESGRPPTFPTFAEGARQVRLCEAIAESAATERWVSVGDPEPTMESMRPPSP